MANKKYCVMDIGGTKIFTFLIDDERNVLFKKMIPTRKSDDIEVFLAQLDDALNQVSNQLTEGDELEAAGLSIAAFINYEEGTIYSAPNLPVKELFPLRNYLEKRWGIPVLMENDANAAVLGEVTCGAARGFSNVIYVTVSTGIGGGLYLDNKLYRGREGFAGEIGHMKQPHNDSICGCGKKGCLESIASGTAIELKGRELLNDSSLNTSDIFDLYKKEDKDAETTINNAINSLGLTFANIISLLNLDCIVIGGGVTKSGDFFINAIEEIMENNISIPGMKKVELVKAALEPESGVWGVYSLLTAETGGESFGCS